MYDTLAGGRGKRTRSVRYEPPGSANAYTKAVVGYDPGGRPTGTTVSVPASDGLCVSGTLEPCTLTNGYAYRPNGTLSQITYPALSGLPAGTLTTLFNTVGLAEGLVGSQIYAQGIVYNQLDQMIAKNLGEHGTRVALSYGFDEPTGRLTSFSAVPELKPEIYHLTYGYDDAGNITQIDDTPDEGKPAETQCFRYDQLRRVTDAWTPASQSCTAAPNSAALGGPAPYRHAYTHDRARRIRRHRR